MFDGNGWEIRSTSGAKPVKDAGEIGDKLKMKFADNTTKGLALCILICGLTISAHARKNALALKNGKATVRKTFQPRRQSDADFYFLTLHRGQTVEIKVDSNEVYFSEENGCAMYFELFDGKGKRLDLGDDPVGIDSWEGELTATGNYKIKVEMNCIESFTTKDVLEKKPTFKYSLNVHLKS